MGNHVMNHYGTNGDSPNLFAPGQPLVFDPAFFDDGSLDYLDGAGEVSGFIPIDEIGDDSGGEEADQVFQAFFENLTVSATTIGRTETFRAFDQSEDDDCYRTPYFQYGCNHKNRSNDVHSNKGQHYRHSRRGHNDYKRFARRHRQSIRRQAEELFLSA